MNPLVWLRAIHTMGTGLPRRRRSSARGGSRPLRWTWFATFVFLMLLSSQALGVVRRQGTWPAADEPVSLDAQNVGRAEAVRRLARAAGWSVVVQGVPDDLVDLHVKKQPAAKVLELLLSDRDYVASRDGTLISIALASAAPGPAPAAASSPASSSSSLPAPASSGSAEPADSTEPPEPSDDEDAEAESDRKADRVISGGSVRVEKDEIVHDVVVFGGNADVLGTATGDVTVFGGYARIHPGARVRGDATVIGGELNVDDGARVDGDVGVVGGILHRGDKAEVGGSEKKGPGDAGPGKGRVRVELDSDDEQGWTLGGMLHDLGASVTRTALLFVFGAIFLALATERMQALQGEIAARPMRSMALGVVGLLVSAAVMIALCVTVIGIPFAAIGALLAAVVAYAGVCAALTVLGAALLRHRTSNQYMHLGLGCLLFLVVGWLPYLGTAATIVVGLIGFGSLLATRGAGFVPPRARQPS